MEEGGAEYYLTENCSTPFEGWKDWRFKRRMSELL